SASVCSARLRLLAAIGAASGSPPGTSAPLTERLRGRQLFLPHVSLRAILKPVTPAQSNFRYSPVCEPPPAVSFRSGTLDPTAAAVLPGRLRAYQGVAPFCSVAGVPPIATIFPHARGRSPPPSPFQTPPSPARACPSPSKTTLPFAAAAAGGFPFAAGLAAPTVAAMARLPLWCPGAGTPC